MENVYNNPEHYNLVLLGEVELSEPDYSFDILAVWKGEEGFYLGTDSGCSCPSPFENYGGMEDLTGPLTAFDAIEEAISLWTGAYGGEYDPASFWDLMNRIDCPA